VYKQGISSLVVGENKMARQIRSVAENDFDVFDGAPGPLAPVAELVPRDGVGLEDEECPVADYYGLESLDAGLDPSDSESDALSEQSVNFNKNLDGESEDVAGGSEAQGGSMDWVEVNGSEVFEFKIIHI